ncbi:hypothetical protein [Actinacidiphila sp. ITFR-21]|uniref:hypothetical protein n=1 Tax=Actinacidiphila sp. ITFR-21 TaxID=3075199 RepID=UPI00288B7B40|nr:hypothetical protein [Streptomyces sp. ITFR-21]WNI15578.1 hypothetical protein RLT57_08585 [Streptomyces sp. ITFR-21]
MADDINLPNLVSHLQVQLADTNGIVADAARQGSSVGAALGESLRHRVEDATRAIPEVQIDADSTELDRDLDRVRRDLDRLADTRIGVDISVAEALRQLDELEPHLDRLERTHPRIDVQAAVGGARAGLAEILDEAHRVDGTDVDINVRADTARPVADLRDLDRASGLLTRSLGGIGSAAASLGTIGAVAGGAIPLVAGLVATLEQIAPAAAIGAAAAAAVGSAVGAIKIGTLGVGDALSAAFAPVTGGGGGGGGSAGAAAAATNAVADAQRNLRDVVQQTALSNREALRRVADAQRDLTDAQKAATDAQKALLSAQKDAARQLEDQNAQLADAQLDERDAVLAVQDAQQTLDAVKAKGSAASLEDQQKAQLAYDRAVQQLAEQRTAVQRLQADTDAANRAGVNGSQLVVDAQTKVSSAARDVSDRQRDVSDAQQEVARTAAQGAEAVDRATEALKAAGAAAAGGSGGGAAGGVNALAAAMAALSPSARAFVLEVVKLKPAFDSLKLAVQERLFAGLAAELDTTARSLLPAFRRSLDDSASSLNLMAKGTAAAARDLADSGTLGRALDGANRGLSNLVPIPGRVVTALGQITAAAAPAFDTLTGAAADGVTRLADRLDKAFASGGLEKAISLAVDTLGELLHVGGNVATIISHILSPAHAQGGGLIGILDQVTEALSKATGTEGFQSALVALFGVMGEIGRVGGPLIVKALGGLEPVLVQLGGPVTSLVDALGDALGPVLDALGPLLTTAAVGVGDLVVAALPLLPVVSDLIASLGPDLQPILDDLVQVVEELTPVVEDVADTLTVALQPILADLPQLIGPIADLIARNLTVALTAFSTILTQNAPQLAQLGLDLGNLAVALGPLITAFTLLTTEALIKVSPLLLGILNAATRAGAYLGGAFSGVINNLVIPAIRTLTDLLHGNFSAAWTEASTHAAGAVGSIVRLLTGLPGAASAALSPLASKLSARAVDAANRLTAPIGDGINRATEWIGELPSRAGSALGDLGNYLYRSGRALIAGFIEGMLSKLSDAKGAASSILGKIKDYFPNSPAKAGPFSGRGWTGYSGRAVVDDWGGGMVAAMPRLLANVRTVVGGASAALAPGLAGAIPSAGALAASYAGSAAPTQGPVTINLYGTEATPAGVSAALSWNSLVGRR